MCGCCQTGNWSKLLTDFLCSSKKKMIHTFNTFIKTSSVVIYVLKEVRLLYIVICCLKQNYCTCESSQLTTQSVGNLSYSLQQSSLVHFKGFLINFSSPTCLPLSNTNTSIRRLVQFICPTIYRNFWWMKSAMVAMLALMASVMIVVFFLTSLLEWSKICTMNLGCST